MNHPLHFQGTNLPDEQIKKQAVHTLTKLDEMQDGLTEDRKNHANGDAQVKESEVRVWQSEESMSGS